MADDNVHVEAIHEHEHTDMSITSIAWFAVSLIALTRSFRSAGEGPAAH